MSKDQKIKMILAYDGAPFVGWQKQKSTSKPTVQATIEKVLGQIFNQPIQVVGASRTDAGVHALGQAAHFSAPTDVSALNLQYRMNRMMPESLVVRGLFYAPTTFHALSSAQAKTYRYLIHNHRLRNPLRRLNTTWIPQPLDLQYLNEASAHILGEHDFKSFQSQGSEVPHTVRRIDGAVWRRRSNTILELSITGSGFLKQMVRNIVGTLLDIHRGGKPPEMMREILEAKDRRKAGPVAPPQGLYLVRVHYPASLDNQCRKL